jgi:deoxyribonuclease IV
MILGCHVGFRSNQLLDSVKEAISYGCNTFMCYTGAPQNTLRTSINDNYTKQAHELMKENGISLKNVICHAPYIVNLANKTKGWDFSISFLKGEITRCDEMGIKYMVVHPGNAVGISKEEGLNNIVEALNIILDTDNLCMILLETMAGKGTECGCNINEMKNLIDGVKNKARIGVCLDTCHLNDSGVNIANFDNYLDEFDKKIGIKYIHCVHLNDSKNELESKKDRHANIGYGTIGFDNLCKVVNNSKLKDVPKILETPYLGEYPPYKFEIEMLKNNTFNENLENTLKEYYK